MKVERVQDDTGTHIEPPLDPTWGELQQLQWNAAVIEVDTGLQLKVTQTRDGFVVSTGRGGMVENVNQAWARMVDMGAGARAFQEQATDD